MAMRGHASIQGSTDVPTLYDLLPGYLHMPRTREGHLTLEEYIGTGKTDRGWWSHFDAYIVSLLKAWFGDGATDENDYGFGWLPKLTGNHSHFSTTFRMLDGGVEGMFVMGQNPAVGSQHSGLQRRALAKLKWLVVRDLAEIETATFWRDSPEVRSGELRPEAIETEVFLMPVASHIEKEGTFTNTQRLVQFRDKALKSPGDARSELWFMHHLGKRVKAHYAASDRERDWPIVNLKWDYPEHGEEREPDVESVIKEINGYDVATGRPVSGFAELREDGSTACGCWIYSGIYKDGVNQARRRDPGDISAEGGIVSPEWAWAWPANRRILYNRASADPQGKPWSERKRYIWWDEQQGRWAGYDVPDFPADKRPDYRPAPDAEGMDAIGGTDPFIMMSDGRGWLYSPTGLLDGPLPTFYEPIESPLPNLLYPNVDGSPAAIRWRQARKPVPRSRRPPISGGCHDLPVDRAPHGGRDEPHLALAGGAAARDVRRDRSAARRRPRDRGRRLDDDRHRARGDRGPREGHRQDPAAPSRRADDSPDRAPLALGLQRALNAATRPTSSSSCPGIRTSRSRMTRHSPATSGPAAGRGRARRGWPALRSAGIHVRPNEDDPVAENPQDTVR